SARRQSEIGRLIQGRQTESLQRPGRPGHESQPRQGQPRAGQRNPEKQAGRLTSARLPGGLAMYYRPMLVIALAGFAGSVQAAEIKIPPNMPTPSPGLWETQITMPTMGGMSMSADNCVGGIEEMLRHPELDT